MYGRSYCEGCMSAQEPRPSRGVRLKSLGLGVRRTSGIVVCAQEPRGETYMKKAHCWWRLQGLLCGCRVRTCRKRSVGAGCMDYCAGVVYILEPAWNLTGGATLFARFHAPAQAHPQPPDASEAAARAARQECGRERRWRHFGASCERV